MSNKGIQKELGETEDGRDEAGEFEGLSKRPNYPRKRRKKPTRAEEAQIDEPMSAGATVVRKLLSIGCSAYRGASVRASKKTSLPPKKSSTRIIMALKRSRNASSNISRCRSVYEKSRPHPVPCRAARRRQNVPGKSIAKATVKTSCVCRSAGP